MLFSVRIIIENKQKYFPFQVDFVLALLYVKISYYMPVFFHDEHMQ